MENKTEWTVHVSNVAVREELMAATPEVSKGPPRPCTKHGPRDRDDATHLHAQAKRTSNSLWDRTSVFSCCSRLRPANSRSPLPARTKAESDPADAERSAKSVVETALRDALSTTRPVRPTSASSEVRRLLDCELRNDKERGGHREARTNEGPRG